MNKTSFLILNALCSFLIIYSSSCNQQLEAINGTLVVSNSTSDEEIIFVSVESEKHNEPFGVLSSGTSATIGFCEFRIGNEVKVIWEKHSIIDGKKIINKYEAAFDSKKVKDIYAKIRKTEFVFHGGMKWTMKVYSGTQDYKYSFLREIECTEAKQFERP